MLSCLRVFGPRAREASARARARLESGVDADRGRGLLRRRAAGVVLELGVPRRLRRAQVALPRRPALEVAQQPLQTHDGQRTGRKAKTKRQALRRKERGSRGGGGERAAAPRTPYAYTSIAVGSRTGPESSIIISGAIYLYEIRLGNHHREARHARHAATWEPKAAKRGPQENLWHNALRRSKRA